MSTKVINFLQKYRFIVIASLLFLIIRLPFLDHAFLLRGERDIALTGYSLAKTAHDLYGNFMPLEFFGLDMPTPFLSFYYSALWWLIIPVKSVFMARLPYIIATTTYIYLVYEIVRNITKNKLLAIVTALVFSFSPGIYHLSRLALEVNIATPLLLLGILLHLQERKVWSYIILTLSFFAYNGFRPLILPLLLYLEFYQYLFEKKVQKFVVNSAIAIIFFIVLFGLSLTMIDGRMMMSRQDDLVFRNTNEIVERVNYRRNTAVGPEIFKKIFNNKITAMGYYMLEVFIDGQDMTYLFSKGDKAAIYASTFTGQFFFIFILFYYLGFLFLGKNLEKEYLYILGFIPIALIPSVINIDYISITIRSILSTVGYAYIIACGIVLSYEYVMKWNKGLRFAIITMVILILYAEVGYFGYNYLYRRPVTMFESFFQSEKDLVDYLLTHDGNELIYDDSVRSIAATYYFLKPNADMYQAQQSFKQGTPYKIGNHMVIGCNLKVARTEIRPNMIIADQCLTKPQYEELKNSSVKKIPYKDYSFSDAYFIIDSKPL